MIENSRCNDSFPECIDSEELLSELCDRLAEYPAIAVDTEFVAERTYYPVLGLVQVAAGDICTTIDPLAIEDLSSLERLFANPDVTKVFHAAKQDLCIFYDIFGEVPRPIFDTQLAAAFVGYGDQISYAKLVERVLKVSLSKMAGLTDWTRRPLSRHQLRYALDDVRYLLDAQSNVLNRLERMERREWFEEELAILQCNDTYERKDPREMYRNVKRWSTPGP